MRWEEGCSDGESAKGKIQVFSLGVFVGLDCLLEIAGHHTRFWAGQVAHMNKHGSLEGHVCTPHHNTQQLQVDKWAVDRIRVTPLHTAESVQSVQWCMA